MSFFGFLLFCSPVSVVVFLILSAVLGFLKTSFVVSVSVLLSSVVLEALLLLMPMTAILVDQSLPLQVDDSVERLRMIEPINSI